MPKADLLLGAASRRVVHLQSRLRRQLEAAAVVVLADRKRAEVDAVSTKPARNSTLNRLAARQIQAAADGYSDGGGLLLGVSGESVVEQSEIFVADVEANRCTELQHSCTLESVGRGKNSRQINGPQRKIPHQLALMRD